MCSIWQVNGSGSLRVAVFRTNAIIMLSWFKEEEQKNGDRVSSFITVVIQRQMINCNLRITSIKENGLAI